MDDGQTRSDSPPIAAARNAAQEPLVLRLYLAPGAPNSVEALGNLEALCAQYFSDRCVLEIVDVRKEPRRALDDGILVTPTLLRLAPLPRVKIVGNLSQRAQVLRALGVPNAQGEASDGAR